MTTVNNEQGFLETHASFVHPDVNEIDLVTLAISF